MATPADQRLLELCDKWLKSLELHIRYSSLDTDSYWKIQPWPEHQRPSRWIIDVAVQKAVALRSQVQERIKHGDTRFSDSLELMTFLANLIGSEHIERFIPLAEYENEVAPTHTPAATATPAAKPATAPVQALASPRRATRPGAEPPSNSAGATATREMPPFVAPKRREQPVGTQHVARTERRPVQAKPGARPAARQPAKLENSEHAARDQVVADAARLVQWGRKWYELPELIARMAGRPPLSEVRKILKDHKTAIEKRAGGKK
jgi:hypothetical protein